MMLVVTSARKRIALAREDIIQKLFFLIDEFIDLQNIGALRLPDMAPEKTLLITFKLDATARGCLQLDDIPDLEVRNFTKREVSLLENGLESHLGLLHLGGD